METKFVETGIFRLPGLVIESEITDEVYNQMIEWSKENNIGRVLNQDKKIWSFRNEKQRNFFIMRWG